METLIEGLKALPTMFYVSMYEVDRCFGGHEEGGWWYDWYDFRQTVAACATKDEAMALARRLNEEQDAQDRADGHRGRSSVIGGPDTEFYVEDHPGELQTTHRPHYE
jgi:hypothetical protein